MMMHWIPEVVNADQQYRDELRRMRDAQGLMGRPVPVVPWWRRRRERVRRDCR